MVFEDLDAGDEARRNGDYVSFEHPDGEGTALDGVTVPQGVPVYYDGTELGEVTDATDSGPAIAGVLANYDVYGDTGKEKVGARANVKMRGEVLADLSEFSPTVGEYLDSDGDVYVAEVVDEDDGLYRVQVR